MILTVTVIHTFDILIVNLPAALSKIAICITIHTKKAIYCRETSVLWCGATEPII